MAKKEEKTNVTRILEQLKINCSQHEYSVEDNHIEAMSVAEKIGRPPESVYKTLVTKGAGGQYFVFCLPSNAELDLKKAARACGEKSVAMIPVADINKVTGYIRGGCSPIGMKKKYTTVIHEAVLALDTVCLSAGRVGSQVELAPADLLRAAEASTADIISAPQQH